MDSKKYQLVETLEADVTKVGLDPSSMERGWYICLDEAGHYYLNRKGEITAGVYTDTGNNFWRTEALALLFLEEWKS